MEKWKTEIGNWKMEIGEQKFENVEILVKLSENGYLKMGKFKAGKMVKYTFENGEIQSRKNG